MFTSCYLNLTTARNGQECEIVEPAEAVYKWRVRFDDGHRIPVHERELRPLAASPETPHD